MYTNLPNLVIGFHGCDKTSFDDVLIKHEPLEPSNNTYDWLGNGIYFWENSYDRALDWAKNHRKIQDPAVIGAVIDLGHCLNLTDYRSTSTLRTGYEMLQLRCKALGTPMPINRDLKGSTDLLIRGLDCAVIQQIHEYQKKNTKRDYDSVRGVFVEGEPIYPNSGFMEKTHIQLCIVNPNCIKGYFNPIVPDSEYDIP